MEKNKNEKELICKAKEKLKEREKQIKDEKEVKK